MLVPELKALLARGEQVPDNAIVLRSGVSDIERQGTKDLRKFTFVISTGARDRDGDTIDPAGWDYKDYMASGGPVLFGHRHADPPIAKTVEMSNVGGKLKATPEFHPRGIYPFGDMIGDMVDFGSLKSSSVGFRPKNKAFEMRDDGIDFKQQILMEWSIVPIPSNPEALVEAKAAGIELTPYVEWCEKALSDVRGPGLWLPRGDVETVLKIATGNPVSVTVPDSESAVIATSEGKGGATPVPAGSEADATKGMMTCPECGATSPGSSGKEMTCPECGHKWMPKAAQLDVEKCSECGAEVSEADGLVHNEKCGLSGVGKKGKKNRYKRRRRKAGEVDVRKIHNPKKRKRGDKWEVVDDDGKVYGTHDSEDKADAQVAALRAAAADGKEEAGSIKKDYPEGVTEYGDVMSGSTVSYADLRLARQQADNRSKLRWGLASALGDAARSIIETVADDEEALTLLMESCTDFAEELLDLRSDMREEAAKTALKGAFDRLWLRVNGEAEEKEPVLMLGPEPESPRVQLPSAKAFADVVAEQDRERMMRTGKLPG